jgi:hypothetical protein
MFLGSEWMKRLRFLVSQVQDPTMITQVRSRPLHQPLPESRTMVIPPAVASSLGGIVQAGLALYLLPALLVVLVVGALGMLVLAAARLLTDIVGGEACQPRNPVRREAIRS